MKKLFFALLLIITSVAANAQFQSASLTAAGLTCAMCTRAIYNSLEKLPVVDKVDTDIKNSQFVITFKEGANVDPDQLKEAVEEAGFSISKLKMTGEFNNIHITNDSHIELGGKNFHFLKSSDRVLNGKQTVTLVDKDFVTAKEFKKVASSTDHPCVETGKAEECCAKLGAGHSQRIYHVML